MHVRSNKAQSEAAVEAPIASHTTEQVLTVASGGELDDCVPFPWGQLRARQVKRARRERPELDAITAQERSELILNVAGEEK